MKTATYTEYVPWGQDRGAGAHLLYRGEVVAWREFPNTRADADKARDQLERVARGLGFTHVKDARTGRSKRIDAAVAA